MHIGTALIELEKKETTPISENNIVMGPTHKKTNLRVPDLGFKAKAILGIEGSVDLNKIAESLARLLEKEE